jgi:hypothetical protein
MKSTRRRIRRTLTTALATTAALLGGMIPQLAASAAAATCTIYYVSSSSGSDGNSGCSSSAPWASLTNVNATTFAAGAEILFQDGGSWTGTLHPLGSGTSGSPIVVSSYGSGSKPIIAGGGAAEAVYLDSQQYVTIENLEITNTASSATERSGIEVQNDTSGILDGITIENNYIHNVLGYWSTSEGVQPTNSSAIAFNLNDSYTTNGWNGVTISGNTLTNDDAAGIYVGSLKGTNHSIVTTNVVIENNTLTNLGGNDVVCLYCDAPVVQNNVATDNGYRYSGAGFWMALNNGGVWQNNDISGQWRDLWDGEAFDIDHDNNGVVLQYNYTHDNPFGSMEFCCSSTFGGENSVIRYNISQNDGSNNAVWSTINGTTSAGSTYFYNNTVYMGPDDNGAVTEGSENASNVYFDNNIIDNQGSAGGYSDNGSWSHNLFYGTHASTQPTDANKVTSNPLFISPGGGGSTLASAAAYELQPSSPAIGAGEVMSSNGGVDYFGNTVSSTAAPNIGAYNSSGVTPTASESGGFWPLSEGSGSVAYDQTNDHNTMTLGAGASWTTGGTESYSLALTGGSTSYAYSTAPAINTASSYTVSAWVKLNSTSGNQTFASIDGSTISPFYLQLTGGKLAFTLRSSDSTSATATVVSATSSASTGTWYQVTGVYNASTDVASLYVNGVLQNTATFSSPWAATGDSTIGRAKWNGANVDFTNGDIGDVRMYNKVLAAQDVLALGTGAAAYFPFNEGTGTSANNLIQNSPPADFTGDAVWAGSGDSSTNSVALDGTKGTTASMPGAAINTAGSYAISVWVKFASLSSSSNNTFLSLDGSGYDTSSNISPFYLQAASGKLTLVERSSNSTSSTATTITGPTLSTGTWYNVIAEYNASTDIAYLYLNGTVEGSASFSSPWAGASTQFGNAVYNGGEVDQTNGDIDDAVFYNRVLTSTEISELAAS